jgi:hypothetical protein
MLLVLQQAAGVRRRSQGTLSRAHWIDIVAAGVEEQALAGSNIGDTTRVTL